MPTYNINVFTAGGLNPGTVSVTVGGIPVSSAEPGATVTVTPTAAAGYHFNSIDVRPSSCIQQTYESGTVVLTMPSEDVAILARFTKVTTYQLTYSGSIPSGTVKVLSCNETFSLKTNETELRYKIVSDPNYDLVPVMDLNVGGSSLSYDTWYDDFASIGWDGTGATSFYIGFDTTSSSSSYNVSGKLIIETFLPAPRTIAFFNGTEFVPCSVHYYNGSKFIECEQFYYDGTEWVTLDAPASEQVEEEEVTE